MRPRGDRDYSNNTINLTYVIDEGQRVYIERIDIRGNTKTRDYVIRREFDVSEGDAYNRVMINKAERKLRDLDYFKTVSITTEPGSAPDKVVVVVNVEDKSTGSFGIAGGVETTAGSTGLVAEVSMDEKNFLGRGQKVHLAVGGGLNEQSINGSFTDPYFLGNHMSFSLSGYRTYSNSSSARPFKTTTTGGGVTFGLPITDELTFDVGYKLNNIDIAQLTTTAPTAAPNAAACFFPAGSRLTSMAGWGVTYSTIDSRLDPHEGLYFRFAQDVAGIGGDARFIRSTADARLYTPLLEGSDFVGLLKVDRRQHHRSRPAGCDHRRFLQGWRDDPRLCLARLRSALLRPGGRLQHRARRQELHQRHGRGAVPVPGACRRTWACAPRVFADAGMLWGADVPSTCTGVPATRRRSWTTWRSAPRSAPRSCGSRPSVRSGPISPRRSPRRATTARSSSASAPAPHSDRTGLQGAGAGTPRPVCVAGAAQALRAGRLGPALRIAARAIDNSRRMGQNVVAGRRGCAGRCGRRIDG